MPVTMLRCNIVDGVGPVLQIAEGWTANLPDEVHDTIDKRTDPHLAHDLVRTAPDGQRARLRTCTA